MELTYSHVGLQNAAREVRRFVTGRYDYFHVMLRNPALVRFTRHFKRGSEIDEVRILDFQCWCKGGCVPDDYYNHHKHVVVVVPRGRFSSSFWSRVRDDKFPHPDHEYRACERIESPMQLVNCLGSLSQFRSRCRFTFHAGEDSGPSVHYALMLTLPPRYRIVLAVQWVGGLEDLLNETYGHSDPTFFLSTRSPPEWIRGKWRVRIEHLPGLDRDFVLPVDKKFKPSRDPTPYYVFSMRGEEFYFDMDPAYEKLDAKTWNQRQWEMGNAFFRRVEKEYWTPLPHQQNYLNLVGPLMVENERLESEVERLKSERADLEWESKRLKWELEKRKNN